MRRANLSRNTYRSIRVVRRDTFKQLSLWRRTIRNVVEGDRSAAFANERPIPSKKLRAERDAIVPPEDKQEEGQKNWCEDHVELGGQRRHGRRS